MSLNLINYCIKIAVYIARDILNKTRNLHEIRVDLLFERYVLVIGAILIRLLQDST